MNDKQKLTLPVDHSQKGCLICRKVIEGAFACLSAGAVLKPRRKSKSAYPNERMIGFAGLTWHGKGDQPNPDAYTHIKVIEAAEGGQFELVFCSTDCLRDFFNGCVIKLETQVEKDRGKGSN